MCYTEICKTQITLVIEDQILGLDISVDNVCCMNGLKCLQEAGDKKSSDLFSEFALCILSSVCDVKA